MSSEAAKSVECLSRNPYCPSDNKSFDISNRTVDWRRFSRKSQTLKIRAIWGYNFQIIYCRLKKDDNRLFGNYNGITLANYNGITLAIFNLLGNIPVHRDWLINMINGYDMISEISFNIFDDILSSPALDFSFRLPIIFSTRSGFVYSNLNDDKHGFVT